MCFYNLRQWLEFQHVSLTQNSCHSLRKSGCRFAVKFIIIFSMRHSLTWVPSSLEAHLCDFGYWGMGRLSDFVSDFHYSGRSSITFITVVGLGIRPWCWAFRGVLFFPNNWVVIHCILIWKNHIWFSFLSSPEKECSGVWAASLWMYASHYFCQLTEEWKMSTLTHTFKARGEIVGNIAS